MKHNSNTVRNIYDELFEIDKIVYDKEIKVSQSYLQFLNKRKLKLLMLLNGLV